MSKTFVRLTDKNNENRAALVSQLHTALSLRYGRDRDDHSEYVLHNDLLAMFTINGQKVGLISHQNPSQDPRELIDALMQRDCNVIVFTSISFQDVQKQIDKSIAKKGFRIIRSAPFWSSTFEFGYLEQVEVENIIDLLEILTEDNAPLKVHDENKAVQPEIPY
ncbi:MAG: hypothetical protein HYZ14_02100 [Bacteroidetes bacterium]|nr:hypothetical protein [Bacteroidota bacterium]